VESRFTVTFLRATEGQAAAPSFTEIEPLVASESARMMSKAEIMATWEQLKYKYPQQIIVVTDGKIIYDSAQDRLDAKIAHLKN
jgi:hypothetical protein